MGRTVAVLDVLRLDQYTIVDSLELVAGPGLNVLTGETGAGKSIIVDALNLLLGGRGSPSVVRPGAAQAEIEAVFDLADSPEARAHLDALDLGGDEQLVLRRVLTAAGKSRAYVNGRLVPLTTMAALRDTLCDMHGQHDHQSLLQPAYQLALLDAAGGLEAARTAIGPLAERLAACASHRDTLLERQRSKAQRIELLQEDLDRFAAVPLEPGADEAWRQDRARLAHAQELQRLVTETLAALSEAAHDEPTATDLLARAARSARAAAEIDGTLAQQVEALASVQEMIGDITRVLHGYADALEDNPAALQALEERLHALDRLKRRYSVGSVEELCALQDQCAAELAEVQNTEHDLAAAEREWAAAADAAARATEQLSDARTAAAGTLAKQLTREIRTLGMPNGTLEIAVSRIADEGGAVEIAGQRYRLGLTGIDRVTIHFSANAGQPPRPLRTVASGGELSRIMLALKGAQAGTIPLLVFDEIDAGVGGNVGVAVAAKLVALAATRQVFCVTHLPQIAARASTHWRVGKRTRAGETRALVREVHGEERARELARMFGDKAAPDTALEHAQALLSQTR